MLPILPPIQVPDYLRYLLEYAQLRREYQNCACQNCLPSLEIRIRLKICEAHLPCNLLNYLSLLVRYPHLCLGNPLAAVSNGRCENCGEFVPDEGLSSDEMQTAFTTCESCGAILIPSTDR